MDVRGTLGVFTFYDDSSLHHFFSGGSARFYLVSRLSVEPEIAWLYRNASDKELMILPNVAWDFRSADKRVIPYVLGGVGWLREYRSFSGSTFSTWDEHFTAGGGAKIFLKDRVFVAPEFRIGVTPSARFTVSIGYSWRR